VKASQGFYCSGFIQENKQTNKQGVFSGSPGARPLYHTLFAFEKYGGPSPGKNDGNTDPFREFPVRPRGRGEAGRGEYEKGSTKDFCKPYSTDQYFCKQHNA